MKLVLLSLIVVMPWSVFGETISFSCQSVDLPGVHKFDAHGIVAIDDFNNAEGVVTVIAQKAEASQSIHTYEEVRIGGYLKHFNAGEVAREEFDQLLLKTDHAYLKSLNLLLGLEEKMASKLLTIDNFVFRSNCKIIDTFN